MDSTLSQTDDMTSIVNSVRARTGLSREQFKKLQEAIKGTPEQVARQLDSMYDAFIEECKERVEKEFRNPAYIVDDEGGKPLLDHIQLARALDIGEFHLANLRMRGKLSGTLIRTKVTYSRENIYALFDGRVRPNSRHPLTPPFARFLERDLRISFDEPVHVMKEDTALVEWK